MDKAKANLAASSESKAAAEGDLDVTNQALKADTKAKADLERDCLTKAQDHEAETKSRAEELKALAEAKKVIQETAGGAEGFSYGLNQESFVQVRSQLTSSASLKNFEAVRMVRDLARREKSESLAQFANRLMTASRSSDNPFGKVTTMISDMIKRLESEAAEDADKKAYCDKELAETNAKKDDKTAEVEKLTSKIDTMSARSAALKEQAAELQ